MTQKEEQKDYVDEVMELFIAEKGREPESMLEFLDFFYRMELFIAEKGREPESMLEFLDFFYRREATECDRTN